MHINRNEGLYLNKGQKLWKRAKKIIPGGTMLFSKNPDLFLPNFWPAYFEKTKGCNIWDLEGKKYFDLSIMGVGTNILGYSRKEVDEEVRKIGVEWCIQQSKELMKAGVPVLHYYSMGKAKSIKEIAKAVF
jgi:glutamate-1-semialdehyde 2,1-aminomutase